MAATPPNPKPSLIRRTIDKSGKVLTGIKPVKRTYTPKPPEKFDAETYKFKPELMEAKHDFTFVCQSCTDLPPKQMKIPVSIFVEAVANRPADVIKARLKARDQLRGLLKEPVYQNKFSSEHVRTIGDQLVIKKMIPFNPFRTHTQGLRNKHASALDHYTSQMLKFKDGRMVSVQGVAPTVRVKVKESAPLEKLSRDATFAAVGEDKNMARKYLDLEESLKKPRVSVTRRMKQILELPPE